MQSDVIYRVATLGEVTSEALDELERSLAEQATRPSSSPAPWRGGTSEAAKIMNNTRPGTDQRIIKAVAKVDKRLAQTIEEEMFVFDNLNELDDKNLGILLRNVENDVLVVALKGANEVLRDRMYRSEEHTSELQSLMRISYAVFCLKKKITYYIK